jgi:hypothetical protein
MATNYQWLRVHFRTTVPATKFSRALHDELNFMARRRRGETDEHLASRLLGRHVARTGYAGRVPEGIQVCPWNRRA